MDLFLLFYFTGVRTYLPEGDTGRVGALTAIRESRQQEVQVKTWNRSGLAMTKHANKSKQA